MNWSNWYGNLYIFGKQMFRSYLFLYIGDILLLQKRKWIPIRVYSDWWTLIQPLLRIDFGQKHTYGSTDRQMPQFNPLQWEQVVDEEIIAVYKSSINNLHIILNSLLKLVFSKSQDNSDLPSHRFLQENFTTFDRRWSFFNYLD